jgi:mRNA-degrading endonuclease RelE of RelBE toxin-antitoxin system
MKKIILILIASLIVISCSKKEVPFEAFSAEAFVFDIGDGIAEVNSTVRVKGFVQTETDNNYKAAVAYEIDLLKPDSTVRKSIFKFVQKNENTEPISDLALESQFNLDSTYKSGVYTLIYKIADKNSENTLEIKVNFDLEW